MLDWSVSDLVKENLPEVILFLSEIIAIPSPSSGEEALVQFLAEKFSNHDFDVVFYPLSNKIKKSNLYCNVIEDIDYDSRHNLLIQMGRNQGNQGGIIINTHLDVVPPAKNGLAKYSSIMEGTKIYGRGACDAKGQIATLYLTLLVIKALQHRLNQKITVHLVVEEEIGGNGSLAFMENNWAADKAIVLEPTNLRILTAARGAVWFRLKTKGKSGHSGDPESTESALLKILKLMKVIKSYHTDLLLKSQSIPPFDVFANPMPLTFGSLHSGDWPSTVPEEAELSGVFGFLPNMTSQKVADHLRCMVEENQKNEDVKLDFIFKRDCSVINPKHEFVKYFSQACQKSGVSLEYSAFPACCDAWFYSSQGIPTIIFGAGSLKNAHTSDEFIDYSEIAKAAEVLVNFILET